MKWTTLLLANLLPLTYAANTQTDQVPIAFASSKPSQVAPALPEHTGIGFDFGSNYVYVLYLFDFFISSSSNFFGQD
jgi:hypothetical protein